MVSQLPIHREQRQPHVRSYKIRTSFTNGLKIKIMMVTFSFNFLPFTVFILRFNFSSSNANFCMILHISIKKRYYEHSVPPGTERPRAVPIGGDCLRATEAASLKQWIRDKYGFIFLTSKSISKFIL